MSETPEYYAHTTIPNFAARLVALKLAPPDDAASYQIAALLVIADELHQLNIHVRGIYASM